MTRYTPEFHDDLRKLQQKESIKQMLKKRKVTNTKIGRNDKCPCNSGKKYKKCCLTQIKN